MAEFRMPSLGADMDDGVLVEWCVSPGDTVERGQVVAIVETSKGLIDVEIWQSGAVEELLVPEGTRVLVDTVLAKIDSDMPAPSSPATTPIPKAQPSSDPRPTAPLALDPAPLDPTVSAPLAAGDPPLDHTRSDATFTRASPRARRAARERGMTLYTVPGTGPGGAVVYDDVIAAEAVAARRTSSPAEPHTRVTPVARKIAESLHVDLETVRGSGTGGAIVKHDVEAAVMSDPATRQASMRDAIATAMTRANRDIPHYYLATDVDLLAASQFLSTLNADRSVKDRLLMAPIYIKAVALALQKYNQLNGFWLDGQFKAGEGVHPGFAIALRGGGLVAPAVMDADQKDLPELMATLRDLIARARKGRLRSSEMTQATLTISSLGDRGVDTVFGVIYPPQVALVGIGKVVDRPVAVDGHVEIRPILRITLAGDHRATDGHIGGRFLADIKQRLEAPETL